MERGKGIAQRSKGIANRRFATEPNGKAQQSGRGNSSDGNAQAWTGKDTIRFALALTSREKYWRSSGLISPEHTKGGYGMSSIYELAAQLQDLENFAMEEEDDIDIQALADTFEGLDGEFKDKCDAYGCLIKNIQSDADGIAKEIDRLTKKKKAMENRIKRLKEVLAQAMQATGNTKFPSKHFSFWLATTTSLALDAPDWKGVPTQYLKPQDPTVDKAAIKKMLQTLTPEQQEEIKYAHLEENTGVRFR